MNDLIWIDGTPLIVRPIEPTDMAKLERMFEHLSRESIYYRFFSPLPQVPLSTFRRMVEVDHRRRDALVATHDGEIIAVASYDELPATGPARTRSAEIAVTVAEAWQHHGLGEQLTRELAALACDRGYDTLVAKVLPTNRAALGLIHSLVRDATVKFASGVYEAHLPTFSVAHTLARARGRTRRLSPLPQRATFTPRTFATG